MKMSKLRAVLIAATLPTCPPAYAEEPVSLDAGFQNPPNSARPRVWWHWMNGNVTIDGIDKDLDWMSRVGIGGLQNFDANLATPQIVPKRLVYMDYGWKAAFKHAVQTADKKGLEFAIAASPGWSETGGPWVKPEDGMKKLVWSETVIAGGKRFNAKIAPAPDVTGPWQTAKYLDLIAMMTGGNTPDPQRASGEVAVIAVPVLAALPVPQILSTDGAPLDWSKLVDADPGTTIDVPTGTDDAPGGIVLTYPKPVTVQSLRLYIPHAKPPFGSAPYQPEIEAEVGGGWKKLGAVSLGEASSTTGFAPTTAQRFRILLARNTAPKSAGFGGGAPGAEAFDIFSQPTPKSIKFGDVRLSGDARVNHAEAKAGFDIVNDYLAIADSATGPGLPQSQLIDLTSKLKPDSTLDWTPPKGTDWRVYRFGWSLTGKTNHPAPPEATGLEVDKYDAAAVRRYIETYLGMYRNTVGADLMGAKGIRALLTDSIEVGQSNWTLRMIEEFKTRRGYDLLPWLPALAGEVIGTPAQTEKFLSDYRSTLADLLADAHYGTIAKVAHEHGLKVYGEAHENGRPVLGDDLAMRTHADIPMAALWTWGDGQPRSTLVGDMKGAASVAHVYGQNIVAAESMTAANSPWAFAPADLKRVIDLEFASGVNRPVIHTSVHQPVDDKKPGLSLMIFGQYFNRHESWAEMAKPWVDYISRTSFMLQQGRNHADIAYFYGEEAPVTGLFEFAAPKDLPTKYAYDFVNANMLRDALSVAGGEIVAKGGARYKALYLGGRSQVMTLGTLKRIAALVDAGATLIGQKPNSSPSLNDDPAEFSALADKLWTGTRVIPSNDIEASLVNAGTGPDFHFAKPQPDSEILFVHRKLGDGDVYFLNNRQNRAEKIEARFRVTGKQPELWNSITGQSTPLSFTVTGMETVVPLDLKAQDATFVVFRKPLAAGVNGASFGASARTQSAPLSGSWSVAFQPGRGAPVGINMRELLPLNQSTDAGVKYFSGVATYTTSFALPKKAMSGAPLWIDLGKVGDVAEVLVNGQMAGTVWLAPNRVDIGKLVKEGANTLEVRVANLWVNRLIGDKQPGAEKITFTAAPTYTADAPLRPSGLIGPVTLEY
jgi:alpha-L-rhamnosidase